MPRHYDPKKKLQEIRLKELTWDDLLDLEEMVLKEKTSRVENNQQEGLGTYSVDRLEFKWQKTSRKRNPESCPRPYVYLRRRDGKAQTYLGAFIYAQDAPELVINSDQRDGSITFLENNIFRLEHAFENRVRFVRLKNLYLRDCNLEDLETGLAILKYEEVSSDTGDEEVLFKETNFPECMLEPTEFLTAEWRIFGISKASSPF
jgi:hypothetical protein